MALFNPAGFLAAAGGALSGYNDQTNQNDEEDEKKDQFKQQMLQRAQDYALQQQQLAEQTREFATTQAANAGVAQREKTRDALSFLANRPTITDANVNSDSATQMAVGKQLNEIGSDYGLPAQPVPFAPTGKFNTRTSVLTNPADATTTPDGSTNPRLSLRPAGFTSAGGLMVPQFLPEKLLDYSVNNPGFSPSPTLSAQQATARAEQVKTYNDELDKRTQMAMDKYKVDRETAASMAVESMRSGTDIATSKLKAGVDLAGQANQRTIAGMNNDAANGRAEGNNITSEDVAAINGASHGNDVALNSLMTQRGKAQSALDGINVMLNAGQDPTSSKKFSSDQIKSMRGMANAWQGIVSRYDDQIAKHGPPGGPQLRPLTQGGGLANPATGARTPIATGQPTRFKSGAYGVIKFNGPTSPARRSLVNPATGQ